MRSNKQGFFHMGSSNPETFIQSIKKGTVVHARTDDGVGATTGAHFRCTMEGCVGWRVTVKWLDGCITHPCSKGMKYENEEWRII